MTRVQERRRFLATASRAVAAAGAAALADAPSVIAQPKVQWRCRQRGPGSRRDAGLGPAIGEGGRGFDRRVVPDRSLRGRPDPAGVCLLPRRVPGHHRGLHGRSVRTGRNGSRRSNGSRPSCSAWIPRAWPPGTTRATVSSGRRPTLPSTSCRAKARPSPPRWPGGSGRRSTWSATTPGSKSHWRGPRQQGRRPGGWDGRSHPGRGDLRRPRAGGNRRRRVGRPARRHEARPGQYRPVLLLPRLAPARTVSESASTRRPTRRSWPICGGPSIMPSPPCMPMAWRMTTPRRDCARATQGGIQGQDTRCSSSRPPAARPQEAGGRGHHQQSAKSPMARKVHASFAKFQALVGPWDRVAEGADHQLAAMRRIS